MTKEEMGILEDNDLNQYESYLRNFVFNNLSATTVSTKIADNARYNNTIELLKNEGANLDVAYCYAKEINDIFRFSLLLEIYVKAIENHNILLASKICKDLNIKINIDHVKKSLKHFIELNNTKEVQLIASVIDDDIRRFTLYDLFCEYRKVERELNRSDVSFENIRNKIRIIVHAEITTRPSAASGKKGRGSDK